MKTKQARVQSQILCPVCNMVMFYAKKNTVVCAMEDCPEYQNEYKIESPLTVGLKATGKRVKPYLPQK